VPAAASLHRSIEIEIARLLATAPDPAVATCARSWRARWSSPPAGLSAFIAADKEFPSFMYAAAGLPRLCRW
jgi:hypothetical protein